MCRGGGAGSGLNVVVVGGIGVDGVGGGHVGVIVWRVVFGNVVIEEGFDVVLSHIDIGFFNDGAGHEAG